VEAVSAAEIVFVAPPIRSLGPPNRIVLVARSELLNRIFHITTSTTNAKNCVTANVFLIIRNLEFVIVVEIYFIAVPAKFYEFAKYGFLQMEKLFGIQHTVFLWCCWCVHCFLCRSR
jgi:hypothetical protein